MKILLCHNYYQQSGGEYHVFEDESWLLASRGHEVIRFTRHNDEIRNMRPWRVAVRTVWNSETYADLRALIRRERPDVVHLTNTFPLISPAAHYAARAENVPVVQSLHNYRLLCPRADFLRNGRPCEDCVGKSFPWPAVAHGCYRNSRAATSVTAAMVGFHRMVGTWTRVVDRFVALTEFSRGRFIAGGLPPDRIVVKPNFLRSDPGVGTGDGDFAVFVGRLAPEKGVATLLAAWERLPGDLCLKVIGDGPLADRVRAAAAAYRNIEWLGELPIERVLTIVGEAACLVVPSICYETFGRTAVEAFAKGRPVIASRLGAMQDVVRDGVTGLHFRSGDPDDLARQTTRLFSEPEQAAAMGHAARREYETAYTAERNYDLLMRIYQEALACRWEADRGFAAMPVENL
jgi:glycosyltransferase involved in cell wall biosynthesis